MASKGLYGLSGSGMDIDGLVKGMMKTQQARYDKLYKQKTAQTWKKEEYNTLYKSLYNFRYNALVDYKSQSTMSAKKATSSNDSYVTAKALGDAAQMSHDITVKKLSSSAYLQSKTDITRQNASNPKSTKLSDVVGISSDELKAGGDKIALSFAVDDGVNGKKYITYTYEQLSEGATLNDLAADIGNLGCNIQSSYDNNNDSFSMYNKIGGETNGLTISIANEYTFVDKKGNSHAVQLDNKAVQRSGQLVNNLHLASYNAANKVMGNELQLNASGSYSIGVTGKSGTMDFDTRVAAGDPPTLADMLGVKLHIRSEPGTGGDLVENWYIENPDGTEMAVEKDMAAMNLLVNGEVVSFSYEDLTKDISNNGGVLSSKFAEAGVVMSFATRDDGTKTVADISFSRTDGQGIEMEAIGGSLSGNTYSSALIGKLTGPDIKHHQLSSLNPLSSADTVAALAGNPAPGSDQQGSDTAFALMVNGKKIDFTFNEIGSMSMQDFADKLNNADLGLKASFDASGKFSVYHVDGNGNADGGEVSIGPVGSAGGAAGKTFLNALGLSSDGVTKQEITADPDGSNFNVIGQSAEAVIDGKTYKSDSNTIKAGSVVYALNKVSDKTESTDSSGNVVVDYDTTKITVNSDDDEIVKNVKKFVEDYNKMLDEINKQLYATYDKNYLPLTDEEKSALSETEIKKLEEKARTGLLAKDPIFRDTVNKMRSSLSSVLETHNDYNTMASLGITTTDYTEHGKIELNEDKLRAAIGKDPNAVYKLFGTQSKEKDEEGIINKLSDALNDTLKQIKDQAGTTTDLDDESTISKDIMNLGTQMATLMKRMRQQEASLYKKFNAMEVAISQMNSQMNFVTNSFGGN